MEVPAKEHLKRIRVVYWRSSRSRHRSVEMPVRGLTYAIGNASHPVTASPQLGCCNVAPFRPHAVHRTCVRSTSDDASAERDGYTVIAGVAAEPKLVWLMQQLTQRRHGRRRRPRPRQRRIVVGIAPASHTL